MLATVAVVALLLGRPAAGSAQEIREFAAAAEPTLPAQQHLRSGELLFDSDSDGPWEGLLIGAVAGAAAAFALNEWGGGLRETPGSASERRQVYYVGIVLGGVVGATIDVLF